MPSIYYLRQFYPGNYYHIYNRGANKQDIFHDLQDYQIFTQILSYYLLHPTGTAQSILNRIKNKVPYLVETPTNLPYTLLAYCLMPNHFHFMLRQDSDTITITNLMKRLSIAYAMYLQRQTPSLWRHLSRQVQKRFTYERVPMAISLQIHPPQPYSSQTKFRTLFI